VSGYQTHCVAECSWSPSAKRAAAHVSVRAVHVGDRHGGHTLQCGRVGGVVVLAADSDGGAFWGSLEKDQVSSEGWGLFIVFSCHRGDNVRAAGDARAVFLC
jgi:hypothetical protein